MTWANCIISHGKWLESCPFLMDSALTLDVTTRQQASGQRAGLLRWGVTALEHLPGAGDGGHDELQGWSLHAIFHPVHSVSRAEQP